jgi:hypothetical protein
MGKNTDKKVSSRDIQAYSEQFKTETFPITLSIGEETITVNVKKRLSLQETIDCVREIVSGVVDKKTGVVSYELKEFLKRAYLLQYMTDINFPQNIHKQWDLCFNTTLYSDVTGVKSLIDHDFYINLFYAIDDQIEYEVNSILKKSKLDDLLDMVMGIVSKMDKNIDFQKAFDTLDKISKIEKIDEKALVNAIAESKETK